MVSSSSSSSSSSSAARNLDLFSRQAEIYRAKKAKQEAEKAAEQEKVGKLYEAEMGQLQGPVELMMKSDNETFLTLVLSEPKLPRAFLKTSEGVNNFLQRFFLETVNNQWQTALQERGQDEAPIDITLTNVLLSNRHIEEVTKLLPNIRTLTVKEYVYDDKTVALNIRALLQARLPKLQKVVMTGGRLLGSIEWERKKIQEILQAQEFKAGIKKAEDLRVYFPAKTKNELLSLFQDMQKELTPKAQFCKDTVSNIAINRRLARKVLTAIEPIVVNLQAADKSKEVDSSKAEPAKAAEKVVEKPAESAAEDPDAEWEAADEADWDGEAKAADDNW